VGHGQFRVSQLSKHFYTFSLLTAPNNNIFRGINSTLKGYVEQTIYKY
jgi:hypothetical protein